MNLFVDTSVWSLAFRRDALAETPHSRRLRDALAGEETIVVTGVVLQELLQGFHGPKASARIVTLFSALPLVRPTLEDHVEAARLRNNCRRRGVQLGTIDALIAELCVRHDLHLLTADRDFERAAAYCPLKLAPV